MPNLSTTDEFLTLVSDGGLHIAREKQSVESY
jgi:hypothetical protein